MRVLLISPFSLPGVGGSSRLLGDIVDHLVDRGHVVEVIMFASRDDETTSARDRAARYQIHRIVPRPGAGVSTLLVVRHALGVCLARRPDVILCGAAWSTALAGFVVQRALRLPYVVYTHGEDVTIAQSSRSKAAVLRRVLPAAAYVMANSRFSLDRARSYGARADRSEWVPPSIDPTPYEHADPEAVRALRSRLGLPPGPVILTLARLHSRKGHDTIVRALGRIAASVPDVRYLIVGKGDPEPLLALARQERVGDRVHIVAYVPDDELALLYHVCDVYAMVSRTDPVTREVEGFGIVYLEAGASGRPCVAGSHGGCADAVEDGVSGFIVDPESPSETAEALTRLLVDRALAERMGAAGRARVREHFSKQAVLPRIEKILAERAQAGYI